MTKIPPTVESVKKRKRQTRKKNESGKIVKKGKQFKKKTKKDLKRCVTSVQIPNEWGVPETESNPSQIHIQSLVIQNQNKNKKKKQRQSTICPIEKAIAGKFWYQRYQLFTRYDEGIKLDKESWYSVTPEKIAIHHADRCRTDGVIIDAFCGCGGNSIQFARTCGRVFAIDIDPQKIELARHNAKIYGVQDKITFIVGDFMEMVPILKADVIFLSPPWGGPIDYKHTPIFDLTTMTPLSGIDVFRAAQTITQNIGYYLPKNTDPLQLEELAGLSVFEIEQNKYNGKDKAVTAYFGNLVPNSCSG